MLTVEISQPHDVVQIFCDQKGLDLLLYKIEMLEQHGGHQHLMTPSWAGDELTENIQGKENKLVNHLLITLRPDAVSS